MPAPKISFTLRGTGVSGGVAIGYAYLVSNALLEIAHFKIPKDMVATEIARFDNALATVRGELQTIRDQLPESSPPEIDAFINTHLMILADKSLSQVPKEIIQSKLCNAEWALKQQLDEISAQFDAIEDEYLRERKQDVTQVVERIVKVLLGHPSQAPMRASEQTLILVAHDISPADAMQFKNHQFAAFLTDLGGVTSHTAILARSLNIPSIVAMQSARDMIRSGEQMIVDGDAGVVIINPDKNTLAEYRLKQEAWELDQQKLKRIAQNKAVTLDGVAIELHANIEVPKDVEHALEVGTTGVGLYRSEFLFMNRNGLLPSEEEQFNAYKAVVEAMRGQPVTIRTLDIGADKPLDDDREIEAANPALSLRAIRYCLAEPQMFQTQLRALLRASHFGLIKILIPMLATLQELQQTLTALDRAKQSLRDDNIAFDENIPLGGMIEIPAAAINAESFARHLDFVSIGTNDLIQYSLAIDRTDDSVAYLYDPLHPAVLFLIERTIRAANRLGKEVSVCGEMAGDAKLTRLLLGLGLRQFSMHPANVLAVKQQILKSNLAAITPIARRILSAGEPEKIELLMQKLNQPV